MMKLVKRVLVCVSCLFLMTALLSPAFGQNRPSDPPMRPAVKKPLGFLPVISTSPAYQAVMIADGLGHPRGIGAFPDRGRVLFNTENDNSLWYFNRGTLELAWSGTLFQGSRYNGGFFIGDDDGYIYHMFEGPVLETLAKAPWWINSIDVDSKTRSIYVVSGNTSVYVLPKGQSNPILLKSLPFESWGVSVRGSYLYISDYNYGKLWRMPKKGGALTVYATGLSGPTDIQADAAGNLYVCENSGGSVAVLPAYKTKIKRIAWNMSEPYYLGLDSLGDIYVSDFNLGIVWMLKKK